MSFLLKENILFFDDNCVFCNKSIRFVHFMDINKKIYFAPLQSSLGTKIQEENNLKELISTVIYYRKGRYHTQSSAIIYCLSDIHWLLSPLLILLLIPSFIRNGTYNFIAKNRKKLFKNQSCGIPSESLRKQIIGIRH